MSTQYSPRIVTDGLIMALDAANTKSYPDAGVNWTDLAGNGINGVLTNGPYYDSANGGCIVFAGSADGGNDGILISNTALLSVDQHTISCWNYSTNYAHLGFMFEKTTNGTVNTQYSLFYANATMIYRTYGLSTVNLNTTTITAGVINSQWNNIVATYDGTNKRIYVNGVLANTSGTLTGTVVQNTTGAAYIGIYGNFGGYPFNGKVSQTSVYDRALSFAEIKNNYNAMKGRYGL